MKATSMDLLIENEKGNIIAAVEVKNLPDFTREEAIQMRHDLMEYEYLLPVPYFLLLTQDVGFLWNEGAQNDPNAPPAYEFPMKNVITRYDTKAPKERLYGSELELLVVQWLDNLIEKPSQHLEEPEKTLALSGFSDSIRNASVFLGNAA